MTTLKKGGRGCRSVQQITGGEKLITWKTIPSWFAIGAADRNIPAELQRFEAQRSGARVSARSPVARTR